MTENGLSAQSVSNHSELLTTMAYNATTDGVSNHSDDWSDETLAQTRYIIQRIIVPCIVTVGIAGNLLTVIVLTR